jgi:hypothetical protein
MRRWDGRPTAVGGNGIRISECGMRKIKAKSRAEVQDHRSAVFWRAGRIRAQGALTTYNSQPPTHNPINYSTNLPINQTRFNNDTCLNALNGPNEPNNLNENNHPNDLNHLNQHNVPNHQNRPFHRYDLAPR